MVKGISRQVIVVHAQDSKLFEQAIFILNDDALGENGVTDEQLLREATRLMGPQKIRKRKRVVMKNVVWACLGATVTATIFLLISLF